MEYQVYARPVYVHEIYSTGDVLRAPFFHMEFAVDFRVVSSLSEERVSGTVEQATTVLF